MVLIEMVMMMNCRTLFFLKHHDEFVEYDQMICTSMNQNERRREKKNEELATYRIRTRPRRMRDALRRLSERFRDRLKRFDYTHNTDKYVRVYMCFLFVLTLFFSHTQKRPLVYVLRIIISFFSSCRSDIFYWFNKEFIFIGSSRMKTKKKKHTHTHCNCRVRGKIKRE